jgi:hypothetical protein
MPSGVIADNIQHRRESATGIVQIGQAIGETHSQVKQAHGWLPRHPPIAIGSTSRHVFMQAEDTAQAWHRIQSHYQGQLRGARISKTDFNAGAYGGGN